MQQLQRADLVERLLQVGQLDDQVAGVAPDAEHGAHARSEPARPVDVGEPLRRASTLLLLPLMLEHQHLDIAGDDLLDAGVDAAADLVVAELRRDVLQAVDHDGAGVLLSSEVRQSVDLTKRVEGERAAPDDEPVAQSLAVVLSDHSRQRARRLPRPIHREVQKRPAVVSNPHAEDPPPQAYPAKPDLLPERGLPDAVRADDHQRFPFSPSDRSRCAAPDGRNIDWLVEHERVAANETARACGRAFVGAPVRSALEQLNALRQLMIENDVAGEAEPLHEIRVQPMDGNRDAGCESMGRVDINGELDGGSDVRHAARSSCSSSIASRTISASRGFAWIQSHRRASSRSFMHEAITCGADRSNPIVTNRYGALTGWRLTGNHTPRTPADFLPEAQAVADRRTSRARRVGSRPPRARRRPAAREPPA